MSRGGVSASYLEDGERWLRVSPGHAISEWWLQQHAPDLYARWRATPNPAVRDQLAAQIEHRLEELESTRRRSLDDDQQRREAASSSLPIAEPVALELDRTNVAAERDGIENEF